jgi:hypothetical protein
MVGAFLLGNKQLGGSMQVNVKVFDWFPSIPVDLWSRFPAPVQAWAMRRSLRQRREAKWKKLHVLSPSTLQQFLWNSLAMVHHYHQLTHEEREILTEEEFKTLRGWTMEGQPSEEEEGHELPR